MKQKNFNKKKVLKILIYILEFLAVGIVVYIFILPFYPALKYKILQRETVTETLSGTKIEALATHKNEGMK